MSGSRPYDHKLDWAEQHLIKFERVIAEYIASHPYEMLPPMQDNKKGTWFLHFTAQPDPSLGFILGDFLYNLRAALDYAVSAVAPSSNRSRVNFPILWQGVWEVPLQGEDKQRLEDRALWQTFERAMGTRTDAVAIIKQCQPDKPARDGSTHTLAMLNKLRNKDTHQRLNIISHKLSGPMRGWATLSDGCRYFLAGRLKGDEGLDDGAYVDGIPPDAVKVEVVGTPATVIRPGMDEANGYDVRAMRDLVLRDARMVLDALRPLDRRP